MINSQLLPFAGCGVLSGAIPSFGSYTISTTNPLIAYSFVASDTQLNSIQISIASISASPVVMAYIAPNVATGTVSSTPDTSPLTNAIASATGNTSLVAGINSISFNSNTLIVGTTYWIVLQYVSGTNAVINRCTSPMFAQGVIGNKPAWPFNCPMINATSSVEPVTWATQNGVTLEGTMSLTYPSGTMSFCASALVTNSTDKIYHTNDGGTAFKGIGQYWVMGNSWTNLAGCIAAIRKATGNVAGGIYANLYINGAFVCKSGNTIVAADMGQSSTQVVFKWPTTIKVPPYAEVMCVFLSEVNASDNTTNYYYSTTATIVDDAITNAGIPLKGKIRFVIYADGAITKVPTKFMMAGLLLDANDPFPEPPLNRRQFNSLR